MKFVVDTNVLVSSLLSSKGPPRILLRFFLGRRIDWLVNDLILAEYETILSRKEFPVQWSEVLRTLEFIRLYAVPIPYIPDIPEGVNIPDLGDLPFISCARQGKADALVTGNKKHFPASLCKGINVISPSDFLDFYTRGR